jgi:hypothetical protein
VFYLNGASPSDGPANSATIRNNAGDLRLAATGTNPFIYLQSSTSNVGINTTTATQQLDVAGYARIGSSTSDTSRLIIGRAPGTTNFDYSSVIESVSTFATNYQSTLRFYTHGTATTGADPTLAMTINPTQQVGIGIAPSYKFHVDNGATNGVNAVFQASTIVAGNTTSMILGKALTTNNSATILWNHIGEGLATNYLGLGYYGGDNKMCVTASGTVGIGTTSPGFTLDVYGGIRCAVNGSATAAEGSNTAIAAYAPGGTTGNASIWMGFDPTNDCGYINSARSGQIRPVCIQTRGGNIGGGTTNPSDILHILGTSNPSIRIDAGSAGTTDPRLHFYSGATFRGRVAYSYGGSYMYYQNDTQDVMRHYNGATGAVVLQPVAGNVGIGTLTPAYKQHIYSGDSSYTYYGPNATWGAFLLVGAGGATTTASGKAQVISTNGNLHVDSGTGQFIYLNYFNQGSGIYSYGPWTHTGAKTITGNLTPGTVSNSGGGTWYFGPSAWTGSTPATSGTNSVAGIIYSGGSASQLFTFSSGPGQCSVQMDGSCFVGDSTGIYNPFGANGSSGGYILAQNGISSGGAMITNSYHQSIGATYVGTFLNVGGVATGGGSGNINGNEFYNNSWYRVNSDNTGLYSQYRGHGVTIDGATYCNISTYGGGNNGWQGYACTTGSTHNLMFSGNGGGIHMNNQGWIIYNDGSNTDIRYAGSAKGQAVSYGWATYGLLTCNGDIQAYYSDERLKEDFQPITNAIEKIKTLDTFTYVSNGLARSFDCYKDDTERHVGVSAQQIQKVLPEVVKLAPFDIEVKDEKITSKSGQNYLTVQYDKLVPFIMAALKEEIQKREALEERLEKLLNKL